MTNATPLFKNCADRSNILSPEVQAWPAYLLLIWQKNAAALLKTFVIPFGEFHFGRHIQNDFSFDHVDLPQFYATFKASPRGLELETVPGNLLPIRGFLQILKRAAGMDAENNRTTRLKNKPYRYKSLVFQMIAPDQVLPATWPKGPERANLPSDVQSSARQTLRAPAFSGWVRVQRAAILNLSLALLSFYFSMFTQNGLLFDNTPPQVSTMPPKPLNKTAFQISMNSTLDSLKTARKQRELILQQHRQTVLQPVPTAKAAAKLKAPSISSTVVVDSLQQAIELFAGGEETKSISLLLKDYAQYPLKPHGIQAAQLAKTLKLLQERREDFNNVNASQKMANESQIFSNWEDFLALEKDKLGGKASRQSLAAGATMFYWQGERAFQTQQWNKARKYWEKALTLNPLHERSQRALDKLQKLAEINFQKAYVLAKLNPAQSKKLLQETLSFAPRQSAFAKRLENNLSGDIH